MLVESNETSNREDELEIKLNQIKSISDISYMFHSDANEPSIYLSKTDLNIYDLLLNKQ